MNYSENDNLILMTSLIRIKISKTNLNIKLVQGIIWYSGIYSYDYVYKNMSKN